MSPPIPIESGAFFSTSRTCAVNLAMEEFLLTSVRPGGEILFLYENDPAVVIGRFQNPWRECRTGLARRRGVGVYRRISGGGTVVHGPGNLNLAMISGTPRPEKDENLDRVIRALSGLGLEVTRNERHDLVRMVGSEGPRKVSGSAFRQTSSSSLHHATLLVDADLDALRLLLKQNFRDMDAKGVESRPSPVANLSSGREPVGIDAVADSLAREWGAPDGALPLDPMDFDNIPLFSKARHRLESSEWIWERTPDFRERFGTLPAAAGGIFELSVHKGCITKAPELAGFLLDVPYHGPDILAAASRTYGISSDGEAPAWLEILARKVDGDDLLALEDQGL